MVGYLIVLLSVALHGGSPMLFGRKPPVNSAAARRIVSAAPPSVDPDAAVDRSVNEELRALQACGKTICKENRVNAVDLGSYRLGVIISLGFRLIDDPFDLESLRSCGRLQRDGISDSTSQHLGTQRREN